jgi:hypothetical protein
MSDDIVAEKPPKITSIYKTGISALIALSDTLAVPHLNWQTTALAAED